MKQYIVSMININGDRLIKTEFYKRHSLIDALLSHTTMDEYAKNVAKAMWREGSYVSEIKEALIEYGLSFDIIKIKDGNLLIEGVEP